MVSRVGSFVLICLLTCCFMAPQQAIGGTSERRATNDTSHASSSSDTPNVGEGINWYGSAPLLGFLFAICVLLAFYRPLKNMIIGGGAVTVLGVKFQPPVRNKLLEEFVRQFKHLNDRQVRLFFLVDKLRKDGHPSFVVPDTSAKDRDRRSHIHEDLRMLREAFLLRAFDPGERRFSGRFKSPREIRVRDWAEELSRQVAKNQIGDMNTSSGQSWGSIQSAVDQLEWLQIEKELNEAFLEDTPNSDRTL